MTVRYRVGNIVDDIKFDIALSDVRPGWPGAMTWNYGHGANRCQTMGAGVAGQLAKNFPEIRKVDTGVGEYTVAPLRPNVLVYNLYTQGLPGRNFELSMLADAVKALEKAGVGSMTIPKIGAGIGGGDWAEISALLESSSIQFRVVVLDVSEIP